MSSKKLLLDLALQRPWLLFLTIIFGFSGAIFNGVGTTLIVPILVGFLGQEVDILQKGPPILSKILSFFDSFEGDSRLIAMICVLLLAIIIKNATIYANALIGAYLSSSIVNTIRLKAIQLLLDVDLEFYEKNKIGDIVNCVGREVDCTAGAIKIGIKIFTDSITTFTFLILLISISWQITLVATVLLATIALFNQYFVKRAKYYGKLLAETSKQYSNKLLEILTGIRLIKNVSNEEQEYQRIEQYIKEREIAQLKSQATFAIISPINEVAGIIVILGIILIGNYFFREQLQSIAPILLTYLVILFRLLPFVSQLNNSRSQFANNIPSVDIVANFLRRDDKSFMPQGKKIFKQLERGIQFEQLSFAYPGHKKLVLRAIDLWIPKGKTIALVGESGAGKSTIADLIPRFYDSINGRILIDDRDIQEYDLNSLRKAMGVVSQDTFLFNNSVRYNIAYGLEKVTESDIITAAKRANAYDFIEQLPNGLDTEIGDRGVMLSGGQRQRIAIARALLRDPDILILDEATSALDTVSERLVQEAIDELCRDRTTIVIAHRLSTIQKAHQIVVLDQGEIVEIGTHEELLQQDGFYARLYSMQFSKDKTHNKVILPANESMIRASLRAIYQIRTHLSYELRTNLHSMIGCLRLITDGLADNPEEQSELIEKSYYSALELLNALELYINKSIVEPK